MSLSCKITKKLAIPKIIKSVNRSKPVKASGNVNRGQAEFSGGLKLNAARYGPSHWADIIIEINIKIDTFQYQLIANTNF